MNEADLEYLAGRIDALAATVVSLISATLPEKRRAEIVEDIEKFYFSYIQQDGEEPHPERLLGMKDEFDTLGRVLHPREGYEPFSSGPFSSPGDDVA